MPMSTEQEIRTFEIVKEETIAASMEIVFETILEELGPYNETPDGTSLAMKIEAWPGGRWYRDLENDAAFLGPRAGDQAADAAGNMRSALHVVSGRLECAIPVDGGRRHDAIEICPSRDGADSYRNYRRGKKCQTLVGPIY